MNFYRKKHLYPRWHLNLEWIRIYRLIFFLMIFSLFADNTIMGQNDERVIVFGTVKDENNEPMPGVNVLSAKVPGLGTVSNIDGNYSIVVAPDDVLRFSFIGFSLQEVAVDGRTAIHVVMQPEVTALDEVVLIGYGTSRKANLVGNVSTLDVEQIIDFPSTNLTSLLDGQIPGLSVSPAQPTGRPGAATRLIIHGTNTFGTTGAGGGAKEAAPLYVVDGFIVSQEEFDMLDISDIENFSVLKDASAAVYGARGANGVILVQTRRGKADRLRVNYSGSYGISDATQQTEMLSAYDHARMLNELNYANTEFEPFSDEDFQALRNIDHNWLKDAWKLASISRHSINLSGGSDRLRIFGGGTHIYETGNFNKLDVTKFNYRIGVDAELIKNLMLAVTLTIDNKEVMVPYTESVGSNTMENLFEPLLQAPRWMPHHINGLAVYSSYLRDNPFAFFDSNSYRHNQDKGNTFNASLRYKFEQINGLEAGITYSRRENHNYSKQYSIPYELYEFSPLGDSRYLLSDEIAAVRQIRNSNRIFESYNYGQNYQFNANLNYDRNFGVHNIQLFASYEQSENEYSRFDGMAQEQKLIGVETQLAFENEQARTRGWMGEGGRRSGIGRFNYNYDNRYIFESTVRIESSTSFAPGKRRGVFPAFGAAWVLSEEQFFRDNVGFIDFLKLRGSAGRTGIDYIGDYQYRLEYTTSDSYLFGTNPLGGISAQNNGVVSTGVSWEKSDLYNAGIDMHFLGNRLMLSLDAFYRYTFDILDQRTVIMPITTGITKMVSENIGRLEAWGYDMSLEWKARVTSDFSYNIKGVFAYNTNRVLDRPTEYSELDFRYPIGKSTYAASADEGFFDYGIIRTQEQLEAINQTNQEQFGYDMTIYGEPLQLGMLYYQDIGRPGNIAEGEPPIVFEPDGRITDEDITYIQRVNDDFHWKNLLPSSTTIGAKWKNVSVNMQFNMMYGITNREVDKLARSAPTINLNAPAFWKDFYTEDNINAKYPSPRYASFNELRSSFWYKDRVLLRLRNLNVSYTLPAKLVNDYGLTSIRVFFVGTNLWTPISTFDYKEDAIARFNSYPFLKTYNFGLNLSF